MTSRPPKSILGPNLKTLVQKSNSKAAAAFDGKKISEPNFLHRKTSKREDTILKKYPDIGEKIEEFVRDQNVGADKWRKTGVLTFDGNMKGKQKVTYERICRVHTIANLHTVQLSSCVLHTIGNTSHRHATKELQRSLTTGRARKGFQLWYNPDFHWSNAFYRGLDFIQLTDGSNIMTMSGQRGNIMTTSGQWGEDAGNKTVILININSIPLL